VAITKTSPHNAGIFATRKVPPMKSLLETLAADARVSETRADERTFFHCEWQDVAVQLSIDPNWDGPTQCAGMKGWISRQAVRQDNKAAVAALVQRIDSTVDCVGSVISPGYDQSGKAASLVLALATAFDGFIFSHQSFYDARGVKIIGSDSDPTSLKVMSGTAREQVMQANLYSRLVRWLRPG
jgi:hypothetical protein